MCNKVSHIDALIELGYSHGAVWSFLVADEIVGGEDHLADITVETCFMPVLIKKRKTANLNTFLIKF